MLRNKDGMATERGLFPVIFRYRGRQALCNKVFGMKENRGQSFGMQINKLFRLEVKFAAESGR